MAVRAHTGYEHGDPSVIPGDGANTNPPISDGVSTDTPNSGNYCRRLNFGNTDDQLISSTWTHTSGEAVGVGVALRFNDLADFTAVTVDVVHPSNSSNNGVIQATINADGSIDFERGYTTNILLQNIAGAVSLGNLPAATIGSNSWYYIEVWTDFGDPAGNAKLHINGVEALTYAGDCYGGLSPKAGGTAAGRVFITAGNTGSRIVDVDDFYATSAEADVLGPQVHEALTASSSIEADGVGSDGNSVDNHLLVDEIPFSGTDFVDLGVSLDRERYGFTDRVETGQVNAVSLWGQVSNPDGGQLTAHGLLQSNVTEELGSDLILSSNASTFRLVGPDDVDPDTALAWTTGGVNALTAGVEVTSVG